MMASRHSPLPPSPSDTDRHSVFSLKEDPPVEIIPLIPLSDSPNPSSIKHSLSDSNFISPGLPLNLTSTTGWHWRLRLLLFNGILSTCWGLALIIFAWPGGVLPVPNGWEDNSDVTNTILALVAAMSTMHLQYIIQRLVEEYSHCLMVDGFTVGDLRWLQKVQAISIFTRFTGERRRWFSKQLLWMIIYAGLFVHTSSLVSIFQIQTSFFTEYDSGTIESLVPCAKDLADLTLGVEPSLSDTQQYTVDSRSFFVGMQLGNFADQLTSYSFNATPMTISESQTYMKDSYAYGTKPESAIEGLLIEDIPGVLYVARCSSGEPGENAAIWQYAFPDLSPPSVTRLDNGSYTFTNTTTPPQMQSVLSSVGPFNISQNNHAIYALVESSGGGALLSVDYITTNESYSQELTIVCSWNTLPKLLHIQLNDQIISVNGAQDSNKYPSLVGRTTLMTLQGMALASSVGASLVNNHPEDAPGTLEKILADGGKVGMTAFNNFPKINVPMCDNRSGGVFPYQKFVNSKGFGWIAALWTFAFGIFTIVATLWMVGRRRMEQVSVLEVPDAFALGRGEVLKNDQMFCLRDGNITRV